ncbi:MAG: class I SAM-dependent methyltransferase [candidate division Zixibacteria bacterium]|nr:class I SAM-dependent methyltransferase [candidate division Zixibacteria bacterium]
MKIDSKTDKVYPDSGVELTTLTAINYDKVMNIATLGFYRRFISRAIKAMNIQPEDKILDLGCGTGRNACIMETYLGDAGGITGMDISPIMEKQFKKKCAKYQSTKFIRQRIDLPFSLPEQFDKIFISFVIHGFPHKVRQTVIENVYAHLKPGGLFFMLDFAVDSRLLALYTFYHKNIN